VSTPEINGEAQISEVPGNPGDPNSDPQVIPGNSQFGNRYSNAFKLQILKQADACTQPGEIGKLLKSAGITHATLTAFRNQRAQGTLDTPSRATTPAAKTPENTRRILELERQNRHLKRRLEQAEAIIDIQKKVSRLLEISREQNEEGSK
jgi:transposase-like protein